MTQTQEDRKELMRAIKDEVVTLKESPLYMPEKKQKLNLPIAIYFF